MIRTPIAQDYFGNFYALQSNSIEIEDSQRYAILGRITFPEPVVAMAVNPFNQISSETCARSRKVDSSPRATALSISMTRTA
jgi:hypothetical protein